MDRCPKCGSQAWDAGAGCLTCGLQQDQVVRVVAVAPPASSRTTLAPAWGTRTDRAPTPAEAASNRRLEEAWREEDTVLDGKEDGVAPEAKTYTCKQCDQTFPTCQALAGHVNSHRRKARVASAPASTRWTPPAPSANGRELPCPLCCQSLPASVGILVQQFEQEGVTEELALRLAAKAFGLLSVPGG